MPLQPGPELDIDQATNNNKKGAIDKGAAGGYADFQFKKCDIKVKGAGGYAVFRKTRDPTNNVNDIFAIADIDAGGHTHFLNANILESANTISATNTPTPTPAPLATTKAPTKKN